MVPKVNQHKKRSGKNQSILLFPPALWELVHSQAVISCRQKKKAGGTQSTTRTLHLGPKVEWLLVRCCDAGSHPSARL